MARSRSHFTQCRSTTAANNLQRTPRLILHGSENSRLTLTLSIKVPFVVRDAHSGWPRVAHRFELECLEGVYRILCYH
jgi:hypothetical protein